MFLPILRFPNFHIYSSKTFSNGPVYSIEESFSLLPSYKI
ncbi:hypothetical protein LEP1GSC116_0087 [Leptospira interrogans serovar Icterohaemorrhagiae str. Verdun HP]|uniref:Uncharacterized protein n=1 Tax=Leptospira interrogans serovar Icterohaemorrhagiae str. Verdun HP TaxID=1049910 RepID=M6R689_LEPIR|nr:hypothetical protein LEP1GSC116_0087 [Leptospira interrogans serovar Icterohaemorrhagiae str. Verdun HP]